jgi:hypothetical protein
MITALAPRSTVHSTRMPVTAPSFVTDGRTLAAWAARIDADGIAGHEDLARAVVAAASSRGLCPVLVDVLADPTEPSVARERAFGRLALSLTLAA